MNRENLVITRAGAKSLHYGWLWPEERRNFDLLLTTYVDDFASCLSAGVIQLHIPGSKVAGWRAISESCAGIIEKYKQVALIDDDIECNSEAISRCFDLGASNDLSIWQPSLSWASYFTYAGTLHNPMFRMRFVNFVEMMCPFFSRSAFKSAQELFSTNWESGIDLVWCSLLTARKHQFAIVDDVQVRHTRPVGALKEQNGFNGRTYENDIHDCLRHFDMRWPSLVAEGGVTTSGRPVSRAGLSWRLFPLILVVLVTPTGRALRLIMDHIRHQLTRRSYFGESVSKILAQGAIQTAGAKVQREPGG